MRLSNVCNVHLTSSDILQPSWHMSFAVLFFSFLSKVFHFEKCISDRLMADGRTDSYSQALSTFLQCIFHIRSPNTCPKNISLTYKKVPHVMFQIIEQRTPAFTHLFMEQDLSFIRRRNIFCGKPFSLGTKSY